MEDVELLKMAAFKMHECGQRMLALANVAHSPRLRATFLSVYRQLVQGEAHLHTVSGAPTKTLVDAKARKTLTAAQRPAA